jgi:hypothetical protein
MFRNPLSFSILSVFFLGLVLGGTASAETAKGKVFLDINQNGIQDPGELGIPCVLVSNQREIVPTDPEGNYEIEVDDDDIVMILKPDGYDLPVDVDHLPQFYYVHKPKGSPAQKFAGVAPTGSLPESIDFPLYPSESVSNYDIVVFGDPQPSDYREVEYIRDDVVAEMMNEPAVQQSVFGVTLGDVMNNDLSLYEPYNQVIGQLGKTWYNVIGNHDLNFDSPTDEFSDETWHRVFGPNYYAFFYGEVLYLSLDNVHWEHFPAEKQKETGRQGGYIGLFGDTQLEWVKKVLENHPADQLVVVMTHIPLEREWGGETQDREKLYGLLEGRKVLALAAHTHTQEHVFIADHSESMTRGEFHHLINVTVCGAWWKGMRDERGIPIAITSDGVDNGYTILEIRGSDYQSKYKPSGHGWAHQMRIVSPTGTLDEGEEEIIVNIFAASSRSQVAYRIDEGQLQAMERRVTEDPFVRKLWEERDPDLHKAAQEPNARTTHLWFAKLPENLEPGTHEVTVIEKDLYGDTHRGSQIFVVPEKKADGQPSE